MKADLVDRMHAKATYPVILVSLGFHSPLVFRRAHQCHLFLH